MAQAGGEHRFEDIVTERGDVDEAAVTEHQERMLAAVRAHELTEARGDEDPAPRDPDVPR